jgi:hypothetical protein
MATKKTNPDASNDFDRRPPRQMVHIDVDELLYWSHRISEYREYAPEDLESFAKKITPALLSAERQFNLDLANPMERAVLLRVLADLLFDRRKRGRPLYSKKWTGYRLYQLARDCEEVKKDRPKLSDARAAAAIKKRYPERYKDTSSEMMRQRLPEARWYHEENLAKLAEADPPTDYEAEQDFD